MGIRKKKDSISARFTAKEIIEFEEYIESDPNFTNLAQSMRIFSLYGLRFFKLQRAAENPEFVSNLEKQFHIQITKPSLENIVNKMDIGEIDALMLKLKDVKADKIERLLAQG